MQVIGRSRFGQKETAEGHNATAEVMRSSCISGRHDNDAIAEVEMPQLMRS
jgi:hypothetical protein